MGTLGCAQSYQAAIHWQGGLHLFAPLDAVTQITWGRKPGDYSEASTTLAKREMSAQCWQKISPQYDQHGTEIRPGIEPWAHELSLYRDRYLVWQGPVVEWTETRDTIEIQARDVLAWMDRRVIDLNLTGGLPDPQRFRGNTGEVLRKIFARTWPGTHETHPYDNPGITEHARIDIVPDRWTETETVWRGSRTVGELVRDIIKNGTDLFTLGRKVYALPDYRASDLSRSPYRLTEHHITGDIEVRKLGLDMATEGFVAAAPENAGQNAPPLFGKWPPDKGHGAADNAATPPWYGRITRFHEPTSLGAAQGQPAPQPPPPQNPSPALQQVARAIREYGFPCPLAIVIPQQASLSPDAPITIGQLVPGRVVSVELTSFLHNIRGLFRINEIEVTWENSGSGGGGSGSAGGGSSGGGSASSGPEQVQVSLVSLRTPPIPSEDSNTA